MSFPEKTEHRTCIAFPGIDGARVCFVHSIDDRLLRIDYKIDGFNDFGCPGCDRSTVPLFLGHVKYVVAHVQLFISGKALLPGSIVDGGMIDEAFPTAFGKSVGRVLVATSPGTTMTYATLAARAGNAGASRAVGTLMRKNKFPILIPCHRVVSSTGMGGYAGNAHPLLGAIKRQLLGLERGLVSRGDSS